MDSFYNTPSIASGMVPTTRLESPHKLEKKEYRFQEYITNPLRNPVIDGQLLVQLFVDQEDVFNLAKDNCDRLRWQQRRKAVSNRLQIVLHHVLVTAL